MDYNDLHIVDENFIRGAYKAVADRLGNKLTKNSSECLRKASMGELEDPFAMMAPEELTLVKNVFDKLSIHLQNMINLQLSAMAQGAGMADASMMTDAAMMDPAMAQQAAMMDPAMAQQQGAPVLDGQVPTV